jgi:NCS1 family nucleobase:cation symporter-1
MFSYGTKLGVNWRAIAAWCFAVGLTISGVANSIKPGSVGPVSIEMYKPGFLLSFTAGVVCFAALNHFFPLKQAFSEGYDLKTVEFEQFASTEGYLEGECEEDITKSIVEILDSSEANSYVQAVADTKF